ncbi:hypothetical protein D0962_28460 [Leptolyngbyaceae cyanobacterium CCMR0082]|uniref:Uncharacterized protein n=1 Tax=Adonisia turfae CCMR0082 TaxID=2304604 RepID=A0A6M0SE85_9CYAN|nr:hypothetical protein [Adonisia turfae]NEZ66646.1 hypothetical protein [Adonisia turfae CCMR0082]
MKRFLQNLVLASAIAAGSLGFQGEARAQYVEINPTALRSCRRDQSWTFVGPSHCYRFFQDEDTLHVGIVTLTHDGYIISQVIGITPGDVVLSEAKVIFRDGTLVGQAIIDVASGTIASGRGDWASFHEDAWKARQLVAEYSGYHGIY